MGWTAPGLTWQATNKVLCQPDIPYFLISGYKGTLGGCGLDCGRCCVGAPGFCARSSHCYPRAWKALDMQPAHVQVTPVFWHPQFLAQALCLHLAGFMGRDSAAPRL